MKKILAKITILAILLVPIAMVNPAIAAGPVCAVPGEYPNIQSAVNDPVCTTINVAVGSYPENVTIPRSLTLNGAQAGVDARTRSSAESILTGNITVNAGSVTVDGFTVNNAIGTGAFIMLGGNFGETIKNNIINNSGSAVSFDTSNTTLSQNSVKSNASATEGFQASTSPLSNLIVSNNNFSGANPANYNADVTVIEGNSNVTISGNSSIGDGTLIALFKTNGAEITGNTVVGGAGSSAIYIGGGDSNVTVSGNTVSAAVSAVKVANSFGVGVNSNVTITGNTLKNNQYGVNVAANSENGTVAAHNNSITGNTVFGISNDPASGTSTLNGTCNWWGAANGPGPVGPGSGDKITTGVTYTPWLTTSNLNDPCNGPIIVPTNKDQCKDNGWKTFTNPSYKNQGQCVSSVAKQQETTTTTATFTAANSTYYNGPTNTSPVYATGSFSMTWNPTTNVVTGGYYNEVIGTTTYQNIISSGTVSGNTFNLSFTRTVPTSYAFNGTVTLSGSTVTGNLDGAYLFTATGTVTP